MQCESPEPILPEEAEEVFLKGQPEDVSRALVSSALSGENRQWLEQWIIRLSRHQDPAVRSSSAVSLGHLARLRGEVSQEAVDSVSRLREDALTVGAAENALEDIEIFAGLEACLYGPVGRRIAEQRLGDDGQQVLEQVDSRPRSTHGSS